MFWGFYYDIIRINLLSQICVDLRCFFLPGLQSNISNDLKSSCCLASKNDFFPLILTHRNYHVFYYLLLGVSEEEQQEFQLKQPEDYFYLNQHNLKIEDGEDLKHDFERLKQAMEMVGFLPATKKQ